MSDNQYTDECSSHKYFTQTLNIIFHLGLTAYEIALYIAIKRTSGERSFSRKGTKRLSLESGMSIHMVSDTKQELCKPREELNGKSLIRIQKNIREDGGNGADHIFVTDIWEDNNKFFSSKVKKQNTYSPQEHPYSPQEHPYSPQETKKNPIKKNLNKNDDVHHLKIEIEEELEDLGIDEGGIKFAKKYDQEKIEVAIHNLKRRLDQGSLDNPSGYFTSLLKTDDLKKAVNPEDKLEANKNKAEEVYKKYNGIVVQGIHISVEIHREYLEIICGGTNGDKQYEYSDSCFSEKVQKRLDKIDRL